MCDYGLVLTFDTFFFKPIVFTVTVQFIISVVPFWFEEPYFVRTCNLMVEINVYGLVYSLDFLTSIGNFEFGFFHIYFFVLENWKYGNMEFSSVRYIIFFTCIPDFKYTFPDLFYI